MECKPPWLGPNVRKSHPASLIEREHASHHLGMGMAAAGGEVSDMRPAQPLVSSLSAAVTALQQGCEVGQTMYTSSRQAPQGDNLHIVSVRLAPRCWGACVEARMV